MEEAAEADDTVCMTCGRGDDEDSMVLCDGCDKKHWIFAEGGARRAADDFGIPFLGQLPLQTGIRQAGDLGLPIVDSEPNSPVSRTIVEIARTLAGRISVANAEAAAREELQGPSPAGKRSLPIVG